MRFKFAARLLQAPVLGGVAEHASRPRTKVGFAQDGDGERNDYQS